MTFQENINLSKSSDEGRIYFQKLFPDFGVSGNTTRQKKKKEKNSSYNFPLKYKKATSYEI